MKPTHKKVIAATIGRDYSKPKLRPPVFEYAPIKEVSFGSLSDVLEAMATMPPVEEEAPVKPSIWASVKRFIPFGITQLVTAQ